MISIAEGMSAQVHTSFTGNGAGGPNAITVGFALLLGARDPALGLLAALPVYGNGVQLLAAALAPRLARRKGTVVAACTLSRVAWLVVGAIPLLSDTLRGTALGLFLVAWALTNALMSLSSILWVSSMADLCPPRIRGRYFARRNLFCTVAAILAPFAVSLLLDRWFGGVPRPDLPDDGLSALRARGFALTFGAAALFGILCGVLLTVQPEPERTPAPGLGPAAFLEPLRDRRFRPLLLFVFAFGATNGMANPFWNAFMLEEMKLSYTFVNSWYTAIQGTAMVITLFWWGKVSDKLGNRAVIGLALGLIVTHPLYYVFASTPERWPLMLGDAISSGIAWAGYNLAIFNLVLALAPRDRREVYYAVYSAGLGFAQATTSVISGSLVGKLPAVLVLAHVPLDPRQQVFLATHLARLGCLAFFLAAVEDPGGRPLRSIVVAVQGYVKDRAMKLIPRDD